MADVKHTAAYTMQDAADYLDEVADAAGIYEDRPAAFRREPCEGVCGNSLCENHGCIKWRILSLREDAKAIAPKQSTLEAIGCGSMK